MYRRFHRKLLYPDRLGTHCRTAKRQIPHFRYADPVAVHIAGHLYNRFIRQVRDTALIHDIKMSAVFLSRLQRFYDIRGMLLPSLGTIQFLRLFRKDLRELRLEPIPFFPAHTKIPSCLSVDPVIQIDPVFDLIRTLPVPRHIFGEMTV